MKQINRSYIRMLRYAIQWSIFFFLLYAGYQFFLFVEYFTDPVVSSSASRSALVPPVTRPPSVDGFLPIGALMGFKLWLMTGVFDHIHPSGLVIFIAAVALSVILKKGFCGWICPVGALSEGTYKVGRRVFGRNYRIHRYIDYPLRSLKYLLMSFFIYVIIIKMPPAAILRFLEGDYYKIADVKMLYFFTKMTTLTFITLLVLFFFSLLYKNFWCRYLCPYGALLGLLSMFSPLKITRDEDACINCGKCSKNCPSLLPVETKKRVRSPECTGCLTCVSHCPAPGALDIAVSRKRIVNPILFALLIITFFFGTVTIGKMSGKWHSSVPYTEYRRIIPRAAMLDHP